MDKIESVNLNKQHNIINKEQFGQIKKQKKDHFWKSMLLLGVINVFLTLMNIEKYYINVDNDDDDVVHNTTLSYFRKNDQMNVALAARHTIKYLIISFQKII